MEHKDDSDTTDGGHHCPGLLRVPCSLAINSGNEDELPEFAHHHHHHHPVQHKKGTPMAAFVDTGAQVTVISASAARRAGIYHLMDRRYAGRATGVGHCKVLGRIPARHVYFLLGGGGGEEEEVNKERRTHQDFYASSSSSSSSSNNSHHHGNGAMIVQMDGPALTVIEGTVTKGVDILLGLDVLQDWEAEIRMGPTRQQSITVKRTTRRIMGGTTTTYSSFSGRGSGTSSTVVIPFVTNGSGGGGVGSGGGGGSSSTTTAASSKSASTSTSRRGESIGKSNDITRYPRRSSHFPSSHDATVSPISNNKDGSRSHGSHRSFLSSFRSMSSSGGAAAAAAAGTSASNSFRVHRHTPALQQYHPTVLASIDIDQEDDEDDFSPIASDIESDLDLLDQSGHEFPENDDCSGRRQRRRSRRILGDSVLFSKSVGSGGKNNGINLQHFDDDLPFGVISSVDNHDIEKDDEEDDEDYLQDVEEDGMVDGEEGEIDMSGL